ncbi:kinase-like protein [Cadophora sp. DSE1049]|nr:kinase-like protein [Cadophora sp. DSE1049]
MKRTPKIHSLDDITELSEAYTHEGGKVEILHTSFSFIDDDFNGYAGQSPKRKFHLTVDDYNNLLQHIPDEGIYPEPPRDFTPAPECIGDYHIKRPSLVNYEETKEHGLIPRIVLDEVAALEMLSATPHPNIAKYHGCIVKRGRLVAIVLDKYTSTLEVRLKDPRPFDKKLFLNQIKSAIDRVHSFGLAHNDINPRNIMLDEADTAFLIDFGSCRPVGENLICAGTPGWMDEASMYSLSEQSHDLYAFSKLQEWVNNPTKDPQNIAYFNSCQQR